MLHVLIQNFIIVMLLLLIRDLILSFINYINLVIFINNLILNDIFQFPLIIV